MARLSRGFYWFCAGRSRAWHYAQSEVSACGMVQPVRSRTTHKAPKSPICTSCWAAYHALLEDSAAEQPRPVGRERGREGGRSAPTASEGSGRRSVLGSEA